MGLRACRISEPALEKLSQLNDDLKESVSRESECHSSWKEQHEQRPSSQKLRGVMQFVRVEDVGREMGENKAGKHHWPQDHEGPPISDKGVWMHFYILASPRET